MRKLSFAWLIGVCLLATITNSASAEDKGGADKAHGKLPVHALVLVTGEAATPADAQAMQPLDELMLTFLKQHQVPGAALAVVDGDRLVYARGFGFADLEHRTPVLPTSLFRIASISKPITAAAVLQLVEQEKLSLDERVTDILKVEVFLENEGDTPDERLAQVTVRQLLQHTGGWDRDQSFDPMFQPVRIAQCLGVDAPAHPQHVIRFMFGKKLDFDPGAKYAYSNFGYCLLGRIIEQRSGMTYEQYVRERVLAPLGVERMRIGRTRDRSSFEVRYYDAAAGEAPSVFADNLGQQVPHPYGAWHLEAMDAHGGWIASAVDVVRFAAAFHAGDRGGMISTASRDQVVTPPSIPAPETDENKDKDDAYYGLGWLVRPQANGVNAWHTGSLPGTSTLLVSRHDGRHWAILFNGRNNGEGKRLSALIDPLLHQAVDAISDWPQSDLFPRYLPASD